uniref:Cytochrome P450 71D616 n=1 Tax=Leucophyllum frutescens TaxID=86643 RepID=A0A7G6J4L0_LEUFR|nr:cytochrome P450 71D616 [Leucophyllum frutescens]
MASGITGIQYGSIEILHQPGRRNFLSDISSSIQNQLKKKYQYELTNHNKQLKYRGLCLSRPMAAAEVLDDQEDNTTLMTSVKAHDSNFLGAISFSFGNQAPFKFTTSLLIFSSFMFLLVKSSEKTKVPARKYENLPPSPPKLPLIGHLHHLLGGLPHHTLARVTEKFGPVVHLQIGEISTVVISSPEAAKEVLKVRDTACANRPQSISIEIMLYNYADFVFAPYDEFWRQMRKICIMEMLSARNVKSYGSIRQDEVLHLIKSLQSASGRAINLSEKIFATTSSIVCRVAFGKVLRDRDTLIDLMKKGISLAAGFELVDVFPSFKMLHAVSWNRNKLLKMHKELDAILDTIVEGHKLKENGEYGGEDIVDVLLRMKESGELKFPITNENIKAVIFDVFAAATDTSSSTVDWAMAELVKNPNAYAKAQAEVRQAFTREEIVDAERHLHKLNYLKLVIKETLRLHPPVPLLPRASREECEVNGYSIPLNSKVLVNIWSMGRDPKYWDEPESFRPERFENNNIEFFGNNFEYIPFGSGKRICPGISFGMANVELPLAHLLYHFDWKLPEGMTTADVDLTEAYGLAVIRKNALVVEPTSYNPST